MMRIMTVGACALVATSALAAEFTVEKNETLEGVRDRIRAARAAGRVAADEAITVTVPDGVYPMSRSLILDSHDSGTENAPIVWRSASPMGAKIRGGVTLAPSRFRPLAESDPLWTAFRPEARGKIVTTDLTDIYKSPLKPWPDNGPMRQFNMHPAPSLFLGDEILPLARYPDAPRAEKIEEKHQLFDYEKGFATFYKVGTGATNEIVTYDGVIIHDDDRMDSWDPKRVIWGNGYWSCDWSDSMEILRRVNPKTHQLKVGSLKTLWGGNPKRRRRFNYFNIPEELTSPGEWYLDRETRRLYYMPMPDVKGDLVLADMPWPLLQLSDAAYITFENFSFECSHTRSHDTPAVKIYKSTNCVVRGGRIAMHACLGAYVDEGRDSGFADLDMYSLGCAGMVVGGGDRQTLLPSRNFAERVRVCRFSLVKRCFCTAFNVPRSSCGVAIRHCEVAYSPYIAVTYGGSENLIANNDLHDLVRISEDSGAMYSGYDPCSIGTLVFGNSFRDVGRGDVKGRGVVRHMGIYFDDADWGDWLVGNRFERTGTPMFIGGGNLFHFHNNLVVNCSGSFHLDERGLDWQPRSFGPDKVTGVGYFESCWQKYNYRNAPWSVAYPDAAEVLDDHPEQPVKNVLSGNILADCHNRVSATPAIRARLKPPYFENNTFYTNYVGELKVPQPIQLDDAVDNHFVSTDGVVRVFVGLDRTARLSWKVKRGKATIVELSPLALTVDGRDYGRYIVPQKAEGNAIPLADIVTGKVIGYFEVKVDATSVAWRWRIPGTGVRKINGENSAWISPYATPKFEIVLPQKPYGYRPASQEERYPVKYQRGPNAWSLAFPDAPRGWKVDGEIKTPWRETKLLESK